MDSDARAFLLDLLATPSPTGWELAGQRKWAARAGQFADRVEHDTYGNAWATLEGQGKKPRRVMLEAHADEIGFIVKYISKEGFLRLDRVGGSDVATARGRRIDLLGDKGPVRGIIGNTAIHLRRDDLGQEKSPKIHELFVDVGASSDDDVRDLGLRVGHPAVYADAAEFLGEHLVVGRALDNRISGFILTQVLAKLRGAKKKHRAAATVIAVNSVQEEIGCHGARMAAHRLMPDVCVVLDVTHATDTPGIDHAAHGEVKLGGGPSVTHGTSNHPRVVARLLECAGREKIPIQHESSSRYTGTDADVIFNVREGIPCALVSPPIRYMHSVVETADLRDLNQVVNLLAAFVASVADGDEFGAQL